MDSRLLEITSCAKCQSEVRICLKKAKRFSREELELISKGGFPDWCPLPKTKEWFK